MPKEIMTEIGGGYLLVRDRFCCWILKEMTTKQGKKYRKRVSGYHSCVEDALMSVYNTHTREIDARSIKVLINEIKALKTAVTQWARAIEEREHGED